MQGLDHPVAAAAQHGRQGQVPEVDGGEVDQSVRCQVFGVRWQVAGFVVVLTMLRAALCPLTLCYLVDGLQDAAQGGEVEAFG